MSNNEVVVVISFTVDAIWEDVFVAKTIVWCEYINHKASIFWTKQNKTKQNKTKTKTKTSIAWKLNLIGTFPGKMERNASLYVSEYKNKGYFKDKKR